MCNEQKYNGQSSYPKDQLGYTTKYSSAIEKFINEAAEKHSSSAEGFKNSLGGDSGTKELANALADFAYVLTAPRHQWSFTVNYYYDLHTSTEDFDDAMDSAADEMGGGVPSFECWPRPEEVGYTHSMDSFGFNRIWMSGSTDALVNSTKPNDEYQIGANQHWCIDEGGYNLSVSPVGALFLLNGRTALNWVSLDTNLTPMRVSMTIQLADWSWIHMRDIGVEPISTPYGQRNGVSVYVGKNIQRCHVHTVLKANVSG